MDSSTNSTQRRSLFWEVRYPMLSYGLAAGGVLMALNPWLDPNFAGSLAWAIVTSALGGILAVSQATAATLTLARRSQGVWATTRAPLAQESDPRLRHRP